MGWSLKGLLGASLSAVGSTAQDWARKGMEADRLAERDAAQFERQKEMARYNDELAGARKERELELTAAHEEKKSTKERARIAEAVKTIDEAAEANKLKKNTPEYFSFAAGEALRSGDAGLTKHFSDQWDKLRDDVWKEKEAQLRREATAAQNAATAATREADRNARQAEADRKKYELDKLIIEKSVPQTFITDDTGKAHRVPDAGAFASSMKIYNQKGNLNHTLDAIREGVEAAKADPKLDLGVAIETTFNRKVETAKNDRLRDSGLVPQMNLANTGGGTPTPSFSSQQPGLVQGAFDNPQPTTPEKLTTAAGRRMPVGGSTGRGAKPGQFAPGPLYVTDKNGNRVDISAR